MSFNDFKLKLHNLLEIKNLSNELHKKRLDEELYEVYSQNMMEYFLELHNNKSKFKENENNLLIVYLLDLVDEFDIEKPPKYSYGALPDIDVDYIQEVRDYLKNEWAAQRFGRDKVCSIGTYGSIKIKLACRDIARVWDIPRFEYDMIISQLDDKDDDDQPMTWESACKLYPKFKALWENYPEAARDAQLMLQRNKSKGTHAAGLIISDRPVADFVPLEMDKSGVISSAWTEGLNSQDLQPVGLIKYDLLVIKDLHRIALACESAKKRNNLKSICAIEDGDDWSDTSYLNDPKSLEMANRGDLRGVFQFDKVGIRRLVAKGGVTSFDDLVAYSSLYRPGPMGEGMHDVYCNRKNNKDYFKIHPVLEPILGKTYNVLVYQEQIMQLLNVVGEIPMKDCLEVQKAISKKKIDSFLKYKEIFIKNGSRILEQPPEFLENLWNQIEKFAAYGFNKCLSGDTEVFDKDGKKYTLKEIYDNPNIIKDGLYLSSLDDENKLVFNKVKGVYFNGNKKVFKIITRLNKTIVATDNHKFLTFDGWKELKDITKKDCLAIPMLYEIEEENKEDIIVSYKTKTLSNYLKYERFNENSQCDIYWDTIKSIEECGYEDTYDLEMENNHNFVANDIVVHNSHATAYTYISSRLLYLKANYPIDFYYASFAVENEPEEIRSIKRDAIDHGIEVLPPDLNKSGYNVDITEDNKILLGFSKIKSIGEEPAKLLMDHKPYNNLIDFFKVPGMSLTILKPILALGLLGKDRLRIYKYFELFKKTNVKIRTKQKEKEGKLNKLKEEIESSIGDFYEDFNFNLLRKKYNDKTATIKGKNRKLCEIIDKLENKYNRIMAEVEFEENFDTFEYKEDPKDKLEQLLKQPIEKAEEEFYGFVWNNKVKEILEALPVNGKNRDRFTIDDFVLKMEKEKIDFRPIEGMVLSYERRISKSGKVVFYYLKIQDENDEVATITLWEKDFEAVKDKLKSGNVIRIQVEPPQGGFISFTMRSFGRFNKTKIDPENDFRVIVLEESKNE